MAFTSLTCGICPTWILQSELLYLMSFQSLLCPVLYTNIPWYFLDTKYRLQFSILPTTTAETTETFDTAETSESVKTLETGETLKTALGDNRDMQNKRERGDITGSGDIRDSEDIHIRYGWWWHAWYIQQELFRVISILAVYYFCVMDNILYVMACEIQGLTAY